MPKVIFPPAWVLPECEYLLDLVARQALFVDMYDAFEFAWVRDDAFASARLIEVDRGLATEALVEGGFLGFGDEVTLYKENGWSFRATQLLFQPEGRLLHEYLTTNRPG